jgi:hypothetical protein
MRGSVDLKIRAAAPGWPKPYRLTYFTGEPGLHGESGCIEGWGLTVEEAIQNLCADPNSYVFDDLPGYLREVLSLRGPSAPAQPPRLEGAELPLEAGTKRGELLGAVPDPHNLFALVQWWLRGEQIKFRAEACAPEPELAARYEADLEIYYGTNIARITMPKKPAARILEFCVPAALVTADVRFFYRTPENLFFFRENNPHTSLSNFDFEIPAEGVTLLL